MSPRALLRPCGAPGCPEFVERGYCPAHRRFREGFRGTPTDRGYGPAWTAFRKRFIHRLTKAGILIVCGARLPEGPDTSEYSRCQAEGFLNDRDLQLDHEPPLTEAERERARAGDRSAVDDMRRVAFLCRACHANKGLRQRR